ncbi:Alpha-1,3-mannosyl-glycoprotein 2-beta-N-acetylglucosaminyltransferase [Exaiptasia diaphana]|nr:Alpha-1,3-mannosyl-glycoprotein 2-beta-N-acetylglucosaminyltransferase [Exaiptasia diaphana]
MFGVEDGFSVRDIADLQVTSSSTILNHIKNKKDLSTLNIAVLVIACNRPSVKRCLDLLLETRPPSQTFPIVVSQGCDHEETAKVIKTYGDSVKYIKNSDSSDVEVPPSMIHLEGYYKLSKHYKWALTQVFDVMKYSAVIIVEDDLEIAPDFFEYFSAALPILNNDPTLWCISAWNDNGKLGYVRSNDVLFRSDFFPGLGWALTNSTWGELKSKWPAAFWDDWMRHPDQRQDRACIRPEIPRTKTFGRIGVSNGQFYDQHLSKIQLNNKFYPFTKKDMSYLKKDTYDKIFKGMVYNSKLVNANDIIHNKIPEETVRVEYKTNSDFISAASKFGLMTDLKAGVPRMAYLGVVITQVMNTSR